MGKPKTLVKREACLVLGINGSDKRVVILLPRSRNKRLQQATPDTTTAKAGVNVDRVLNRLLVSGPGPEGTVTGKPLPPTRASSVSRFSSFRFLGS